MGTVIVRTLVLALTIGIIVNIIVIVGVVVMTIVGTIYHFPRWPGCLYLSSVSGSRKTGGSKRETCTRPRSGNGPSDSSAEMSAPYVVAVVAGTTKLP